MPKKVTQEMKVELEKNTLVEKGGAWQLTISIYEEFNSVPIYHKITAWANASAAKRWVRAQVLEQTNRKSIKLIVTKSDVNNKPISISGDMTFKVDA